tara:strand:- start:5709 stop:6305 length:597 start_codon:yes stop_codon:yes gene_type:complete
MTEKKKSKETKSEKIILTTIYQIIETETLSEEKYTDILIILKGALTNTNTNLNLNLVLNIYTLLIKNIPNSQKTNNLLFINFYTLFNYIVEKHKIKNSYIRKYLLIIEYYLMKNIDTILKEQIELILYIIQEFINKKSTTFYFQYGFLYLKLYDFIISKKLIPNFKKELHHTKECILSICPETSQGKELKELILSKTF